MPAPMLQTSQQILIEVAKTIIARDCPNNYYAQEWVAWADLYLSEGQHPPIGNHSSSLEINENLVWAMAYIMWKDDPSTAETSRDYFAQQASALLIDLLDKEDVHDVKKAWQTSFGVFYV